MQTIREEKRGKLTLRLLKTKNGHSGLVLSDAKGRLALMEGQDPEELWRQLEQEAAKSGTSYIGFDGARARFLHFFPQGFATPLYAQEERDYKVAAAEKLKATVPLQDALNGKGFAQSALAVFHARNLLHPRFELTRVKEVLNGPSGDAFVRGSARFTVGDRASALAEMAHFTKPYDCAKWAIVTYLPYLWRPDQHMFLRPAVTIDFAERVGHRFAYDYRAPLELPVYESLLDLVRITGQQIADLHPQDNIDVGSFIWVAGRYTESDLKPGSQQASP